MPKSAELHLQGPAGRLNWLADIATNQIRDAQDILKAAKGDVHRQVVLSDDARGGLAVGDPLTDEQAVLAEVRELLDQEVSFLPGDQRGVVLLGDDNGRGLGPIAAYLNRECRPHATSMDPPEEVMEAPPEGSGWPTRVVWRPGPG